jgi:hypothetical protein
MVGQALKPVQLGQSTRLVAHRAPKQTDILAQPPIPLCHRPTRRAASRSRADRDIDTLASQGKGDRLANPGAPAGDQCRLPVHLEIHEASLRLHTAMKIYQGLPGAISSQSTA